MAYVDDSRDPFSGGEKVPSLSWKGLPHGSLFTLEVLDEAKAIQSRNYDTNQPDYWPVKGTETPQPKMSAVINVRVVQGPHSVGEERSIWAQIPSSLFIALKEAQKSAGSRIAPGGTLHIKLVDETPHKDPKKNPIKNYVAKYEVPTATGPDPFAGQAATPSQPQQQARPVPPQRNAYATPAATTPPAAKKGW